MKNISHNISTLALIVCLGFFALPTSAQTTTNTLELTGPKAGITAPGSKPVVIKDALQVNKTLDIRKALFSAKGDVKVKDTLRPTIDNAYNLGSSLFSWATLFVNTITLPEGGLVDGVDVSSLASQVDGITGLPDCDSGEIVVREGANWACAPEPEAGTSYTAGAGIAIDGTEISSTVPAVNSLDDLINCDSGEFPLQYAGAWICRSEHRFDVYSNILNVTQGGSEFGTITAAINAINTAGDAAADNQYVITVGPGEYNETLALPNYTHIVGANKEAVKITYGDSIFSTPLVNPAVGNSISNVTLEATVTSLPGVAVYVGSGDSILLDNVNLSIEGSVAFNYAIHNSGTVYLKDSTVTSVAEGNLAYGIGGPGNLDVVNTEITAQDSSNAYALDIPNDDGGQQVQISSSTLTATGSGTCAALFQASNNTVVATITDSVLVGSDCSGDTRALSVQGGSTFTVRNSVLNSDGTNAVTYGQAETTLKIGATQIIGGVSGADATIACAQSYDGDFVDLNATCL